MEDRNKKSSTGKPDETQSHSAFNRRPSARPSSDETSTDKPIPSQPRSFSPVRPQRPAPGRRNLAVPPSDPLTEPPAEKPAPPKQPEPDQAPQKPAAPTPDKPAADKSPKITEPAKPATSTASEPSSAPAADEFKPSEDTSTESDETASPPAAPTDTAPRLKSTTAAAPSSGAGGDTIRLRVSPRPQARTLNTAPGRGVRRRLPDIRQGRSKAAASGHYGPFSLFFGFIWLTFKMIFFTGLVLGLGALIGFMVMTEYIKKPEVTVPDVTGMKIEEAFEELSAKRLGVIKRGNESSGLVAPGEIISQQPPAGAKAKVETDVGVVISSGRAQFVVPSVVNETRENAINKIRGARLELGNVLTIEDNNVPRGNVISQSPIGNTGVDDPVKVDLMISAGPPGRSLTMPSLSGRTVLEARAALRAVGVEDVVTEPDDAPSDAVVTGHDPLVGKTVFQTDRVTLITEE